MNFPVLATRACFAANAGKMFDPADPDRSAGGEQEWFDEDGTTEVAREIVDFALDSVLGADDGTFEAHITKPLLDVADPDPFLYCHFGDRTIPDKALTDIYGRDAVWSDYEGVWHLNDLIDSSGNYDLTAINAPTTTPGQIGDGYSFNGTTQYLENTSIVAPAGHPVSLQCWGASNSLSALQGAVSLLDSADGSGQVSLYFAGNISDHLLALERDTGTSLRFTDGGPSYTVGEWMAGTAVFAGTADRKMFVNGGAAGVSTSSLGNHFSSLNTLRIGNSRTSSQFYFDGDIDEVRWINSDLSADWIATEYANQNDPATFASAGTPEAVGGGTAFSAEFPLGSELLSSLKAAAFCATEYANDLAALTPLSCEHSSGLSRMSILALENGMRLSLSQYLAAELVSDLRSTNAVAVERGQHIHAESLIPVTWSGAIQFSFQAGAAVEIRALYEAASSAGVETSTALKSEKTIVTSAHATIAATTLLGAEYQAELIATARAAVENISLIIVEQALNTEQLEERIGQFSMAVEHFAVVEARSMIPVTWDGVSGFITGISQIFKRNAKGRGQTFAGRGRLAVFPNGRKRN